MLMIDTCDVQSTQQPPGETQSMICCVLPHTSSQIRRSLLLAKAGRTLGTVARS